MLFEQKILRKTINGLLYTLDTYEGGNLPFFFLLALSARECEWYKCSSGMCNAHSYIEYELTPELNVCLSINLFAVVVKC